LDSLRILGKGQTANALKKRFPNAKLFDDTNLEEFDKNSSEITVVSPGIPPYHELVKSSKNLISDYDLFYEDMPFSIWVSGTNGKTTTTQMIQHLLEKYNCVYGGNIGVPVSQLDNSKKIWILETSSFTLHYTNKAKPNIYVLLPIREDHITWHTSFEEYKKAKLKPLMFMQENDIAIIPSEFKDVKTDAFVITYNNSDDICNYFGFKKDKVDFKEPFLLDALLSMSVRKILFDDINYSLINQFKIDKHKVEEFKDSKNRLWIDDSKATNIDATINALVSYKNSNIHIILGGDDKGANLGPLFENIQSLDIEVYSIGSNSQKIVDLCSKFNIKVHKCDFLENAVKLIDINMKKNSIGFLSPAAASLDQFSSYIHRGEEFKKYVQNLSYN